MAMKFEVAVKKKKSGKTRRSYKKQGKYMKNNHSFQKVDAKSKQGSLQIWTRSKTNS